MPYYNDLRPPSDYKRADYALIFPEMSAVEKKRTLANLLLLRSGLADEITVRKADHNLLIASWNIKEFGHTSQRLPEAYFYIAEIMARFDLIAVQEIKSGLKDLDIILRLLGPDWSYLVNDITEGQDGNSERSAYIFNTRRVELGGLAGEIVLWDELTQNSPIKQLKRTPYITGFKSGWKTFALINLHLHPGDDQEDIAHRREEARLLLHALAEKIGRGRMWNDNLILVGDFNLYDGAEKDNPTIQEIHAAGYREVESLIGLDTNASFTEAYDRFFLTQNEYFVLGKNKVGLDNGGVFNPFNYVYRSGQEAVYRAYMQQHYTGTKDLGIPANLTRYYLHPWRKNQLSDHFPIWFELIIDSSDEFLADKLNQF